MLASLSVLAMAATSAFAAAGSLQRVTNFGTNPTNAAMYIYVPSGLPAKPAVIAAIHYCTGSASAYFTGTQYANLADTYKFIVIYPDAPPQNTDKCWDVNTAATLKHDAGGDSLAIANMVRYTITQYGADTNKIFATGTSSGAMMSNVLAGSYPDLFKAIAPFAGVPFGCFAGSSYWNSACANGQTSKTGAQWGDLVRAAYPGYTGSRPRMQIWHGTADTTLSYNNFNEAIKQWTNVAGVSATPSSTEQNFYSSGWVRTKYGTQVQAISETGQTHNLQVVANEVLKFFGIIADSTLTTTTGPTNPTTTTSNGNPTTTPTEPTTTTTAPGATQTQYGQCGGIGWTGPTVCASPWTCKVANNWYSQCL